MRRSEQMRLAWLVGAMCGSAGLGWAAQPAALIVTPVEQPGEALAAALTGQLDHAGYTVRSLRADLLSTQTAADAPDLLVLLDGGTLPARCTTIIDQYARAGVDIIALRGPLWRRPLIRVGDRWCTPEEAQVANAAVPAPHIVLDLSPAALASTLRVSSEPESKATYEPIADAPVPPGRGLHVIIEHLKGWDTLVVPGLNQPFPAEHTLTVFSARGSSRTDQLSIEWCEKDGSRWIGVVPLTDQWRRYVLSPTDFKYWHSVPGRGHGSDCFHPENADHMQFGLAFSHTGQVEGRHEYRIGPIGTAPESEDLREIVQAFAPPALDTLSPAYKYFACSQPASISLHPAQALLDSQPFAPAAKARSPHPRASGGGFAKGRAWRWQSLLEARAQDGQWRGTPATLLIHADGPFKGGAWAAFGIQDEAWYRSPASLAAIGRLAERMRDGAFILDGGADHYTYLPDQPVTLGVRACVLPGGDASGLSAQVVVTQAGSKTPLFEQRFPLNLAAGTQATASQPWSPTRWPEGGLQVTAGLFRGERLIDSVRHEMHLWQPKPHPSYISVRDGDFVLDGRRWRVHGVNYMPSSGIAMEDYSYFEHWTGAAAYDPEVIDRDLAHIKDMGLNAVSIFTDHLLLEAGNTLDLLRRLDAHGLKANLSIRPGTPMDFQWAKTREVIERYRLAEHDSLFAYDLAWEPMFGSHDERRVWDHQWEAWIVERYGSLEAAERDWGFAVPRDAAGKVTNPLPQHIDTNGPWRVMVAAYRRFLDTLLYDKYGSARRLVRGVDPHHLVSFRMAEAANPTFRWDGRIPYDWPYLAAAVDLLEPEAYGRIGMWEKVKPGWFEFEYGRWAAPDKPVMWAEMGMNAWSMSRSETAADLQAFQADYFRHFYRMLTASAADGVFFWWYPGGFRTYENSDYGLINPDGTDRPVTKVIRDCGPAFLNGPDAKPVDHWIEFDRDAHPDALAGIYDAAQAEFWAAIESGQTPGLRTAATGSTSANCPALAVGNTPLNGSNPPKHLDGWFDLVEVRTANGWEAVQNGGVVALPIGRPAIARVTLTNLGEAAWLGVNAEQATGTVRVIISPAGTPVGLPRAVPRHGSIVLEPLPLGRVAAGAAHVSLALEAHGRTPFGPRFAFTIAGAPAPR